MVRADTNVPLPDKGRKILWRKKGEVDWKPGVVDLVWLALDEAAIDLKGTGITLIPAFGDEWQYL